MSFDLQSVDAERRAACALDDITAARQQHQREHRRPKALSAREALLALQFEALLVMTAASNVRNGVVLTDSDFDRLALSVRWIDAIVEEAA